MKDWKEIAESVGGELTKVVAHYSWWVEKDGQTYGTKVNIAIHQYPDGRYVGIADRKVKTPQQASPYISLHPQATPEDALYDSISGFTNFARSPEETTFPLVEERELRELIQEELKKSNPR